MHDYWGEETYMFPNEGETMHTEDYDRYRADYARYLREACEKDGNPHGADDWKYTEKGPIFQELMDNIRASNTSGLYRAANRIVDTIFPRIDRERFLKTIGSETVFQEGFEAMLEARIKVYLGLVTREEVRGII